MITDLKTLQKKLFKVKKELKEWEFNFQRKHHRPPTVQDIGERPNVEKYYKKYNQLKRDYKMAVEATESDPFLKPTSVEFVKSSDYTSQAKKDNHSSSSNNNRMTEEEAFWLGDKPRSTSSMSQPTSSTKMEGERLILGGSQPIQKKNAMLEQKLFGHLMIQNPRSKGPTIVETILEEKEQEKEEHNTTTTIINTQDITMHDSDDDMMEDVQIVNREPRLLRHYSTSDLPSMIGPGFFNSSKATYNIPLFDDDSERQRRERILYKLKKGTLGEALEENKKMENEMDDDVREFISKYNTILHENSEEIPSSQPSSPFDTTSSTSSQQQQQHQHQQQQQQQSQNQQQSQSQKQYNRYNPNQPYKKKPIQRRQTRLYKLKFVETR